MFAFRTLLDVLFQLDPRSLAQYAQVAFVNNKGINNLGLNISDGATTLFAASVTTVGVNTGIRTLF
ncbi:hypothetical protein QF001_003295 [Paraburkholderia youngii]|uniref:hypothetical protein n=1 Tax=Paraburkholderia youngii TaxID=2782701 RepID=UPI003D20C3D3